jgi:DnaJ-class molecular chaperone
MSQNSRPRDYYADLGLTSSATAVQIKNAYRRLVLLHHPDKKGPNSDGDASEFRKAQEAYEKLYEAKSQKEKNQGKEKNEPTQERTTRTNTRPFNVYKPRPWAPPSTHDFTSKATRNYHNDPNMKYENIGSEMEEH